MYHCIDHGEFTNYVMCYLILFIVHFLSSTFHMFMQFVVICVWLFMFLCAWYYCLTMFWFVHFNWLQLESYVTLFASSGCYFNCIMLCTFQQKIIILLTYLHHVFQSRRPTVL